MSLAQETDTKVPVLHITEYWPSSSTDTQKGPAATSSAAGTQRVQCQKKKKKKKKEILSSVHRPRIESVLTSDIVSLFGHLSVRSKARLRLQRSEPEN